MERIKKQRQRKQIKRNLPVKITAACDTRMLPRFHAIQEYTATSSLETCRICNWLAVDPRLEAEYVVTVFLVPFVTSSPSFFQAI